MLLLPVCLCLAARVSAQEQPEWEMQALNDQGWVEYHPATGTYFATNGFIVKYGGAVLTASRCR